MGRKHFLDKFYTKPKIAKYLIKQTKLEKYNTIIEPSAGNGSFSNFISHCIAIDIEPENKNIIKANFLELSFSTKKHPILVIGNPPFGRQNNLAIAFFRKSSEFADTIAFILPKSFRKTSLQNRLPLNFFLIKEIDLPDNSFYVNGTEINIPCIFQIWERKNFFREPEKEVSPIGFSFIKKSKEADIVIRRVGVYAGKASVFAEDKSEQSHYFLKTSIPIEEINKIKWEHNNTVGPKSISKQELIKELNKLSKK